MRREQGEAGAGGPRDGSTVAVEAQGRDQRGPPLNQFQGREAQLRAAIGLGQAIHKLVVTQLLEPLQHEGWARGIA
jgi:hypothetical protein